MSLQSSVGRSVAVCMSYRTYIPTYLANGSPTHEGWRHVDFCVVSSLWMDLHSFQWFVKSLEFFTRHSGDL